MAKSRASRSGPPAADGAADEAHLFRAAVRDVTPLPQTARPAPQSASPAGTQKPRTRRRIPASLRAQEDKQRARDLLGDVVPTEDSPTGADPLSFRRPSVRPQTLRRLRRGLYPIEDELDLHGLSQAGAREALAEFIAVNHAAGRRCVRIVHGKGYRSGARGPILKISVNDWLRRHTDVIAFTSARAIDGGTGAVYVLLRA
jgi:DNA-nicking Smr family endonuclease